MDVPLVSWTGRPRVGAEALDSVDAQDWLAQAFASTIDPRPGSVNETSGPDGPVELTNGDRTLELSHATTEQQERLVEEALRPGTEG